MHRSHTFLVVFVAILFCCAFVRAEQAAPQFTLHTLDGRTYTNSSLAGGYTLLQFWATWCPHCRDDQAALDEIDRRYSSWGLVVVAINEGEPAADVDSYLREHPRRVSIALEEDAQIAGRFAKHGFPYYVLIDKNGDIVATQNGAGGELHLMALLSKAKGFHNPAKEQPSRTANANAPQVHSGMSVIEVPREKSMAAAKPLPKTIFVLKSGERLESDHYTLDAKEVRIAAADGQNRTIPTSALDVSATQAANHARGVDVKIPSGSNEVFLAF